MRRFSRVSALGAAVMLAIAAHPSPAAAQFGGLVKKAAGKAASVVTGSTESSEEGSSERSAPPAAGHPVFSDDVLEITDARIAQLLRGLDAERDARPRFEREHAARQAEYQRAVARFEREMGEQEAREKAQEREHAAWEAKRAAYERCLDQVQAKYAAQTEDDEAEPADEISDEELEALARRMEALEKRRKAAEARGDRRTANALADSLGRAARMLGAPGTSASSSAHERARAERARCPDPGPQPSLAGPLYPPKEPAGIDSAVTAFGARASGLTARQWAILRERAAAFVKSRQQGRKGFGAYVFSEQELRALEPHTAALEARAEQLTRPGAWAFGRS